MATCHSSRRSQRQPLPLPHTPFPAMQQSPRDDAPPTMDADIDGLLASPLSALLPFLPESPETLDDTDLASNAALAETVVPADMPLCDMPLCAPTVESERLTDETPMFTPQEAELLLASLENTEQEDGVTIPPVEASTVKKKVKIPSRKRQQQEMAYLRSQVVELEAELGRIKEEQVTSVVTVKTGDGPGDDALREQIAKRQAEQKHRSEVENMKLRSMLEGQLRVAHSLEKLLTKRSLAESEPLFDPSKRPRVSELVPADKLGPIEPQLEKQLREIDAILAASGLAQIDTEIDDSQMKIDDKHQIFMERTMTKLLPFPLDPSGEVAWRKLTPPRLDLNNGFYATTKQSENDYDVAYSVMTKVRRASAHVSGQGAGRRHVVPGQRYVMVWMIQGTFSGQNLTDHTVGVLDHGYMVIEPVTNATGGATSCILKACVRIWPQLAKSEQEKTGLFVDLTLSSFNENTKTILQMIENDLIEQSLVGQIRRCC